VTIEGSPVLSAAEWDAAVIAGNGHFLQSHRWGAFKSEFGWDVERVSVIDGENAGLAQILFRSRGPVSAGYIPRGPVLPERGADLAPALFHNVDVKAKSRRSIYTLVEPDQPLPLAGMYKQHGFVVGPEHIQPARTVKIPLLDDEALLGQMRQNTRYSVRLAIRRGVEVEPIGEGNSIEDFFGLLVDTSDRNDFGIHSQDYYSRFLEVFGDDAVCLFARTGPNLAAALISVKHGAEAIYMYGASSSQYRAHGAASLLQYEAMRWARSHGCTRYDLWGIPTEDPENVTDTGDTIVATKGEDWRGLFRFKTGFGGDIVTYPPMLERRYSVLGSLIARRLAKRRRADT
jgi:lipid II:glycine glycyltransferase (peptidoglycan interpeptide bridge formation enzyme)